MAAKQNTNIEREVKFKIDSRVTGLELDKFLKKLDLSMKHKVSQKDVYWDNQACDIINLKRGLRVRYISNQIKNVEFKSLFKGKEGQYVVEEIKLLKGDKFDTSALKDILVNRLGICELKDFKNNNFGSLEIYLSSLGLSPSIILEKERKVWIDRNEEVEVSVDTVSDLGIFVEVEHVGISHQVYDQIVGKFEKGGFAVRDTTYSGYLDLLLDKDNKITPKAGFEKKFAEDNMWNVKIGERDIFLSLTQ